MINLSDLSSVFKASFSYKSIENLSICLTDNVNFAKEGTEFYFVDQSTISQFYENISTNINPVSQKITNHNGIIPSVFSLGLEAKYSF